MRTLMALAAALVMLTVGAFSQTAQRPVSSTQKAGTKMKTVRLHIDGFQKSKSGAV